MNQDTFMEYMVKKQATIGSQLKKCGILLAALLIIAASFILLASQYLNVLGAGLIVGTGWITFILIRLESVEYEYIITNNEMDIDKIQGKSKRKRLATVDLASISSFEKLDPANLPDEEGRVRILAAASMKSNETYVAKLSHKELGDCILYFTPNERMVEYIERARKGKRVYIPTMGA